MKKHQEELGDIIKLHDEEKYKLKQQLEDARLNYIKEIENVYSYVVLSFFFLYILIRNIDKIYIHCLLYNNLFVK